MCGRSWTEFCLATCGDLESCLPSHDAWDFLLVWVVSSFGRWWFFSGWQLWGPDGREKHFERKIMTLKTDIHLTFFRHSRAYLFRPGLVQCPFPGLPTCGLSLLLALVVTCAFLKGCFFLSHQRLGGFFPACGVKFWLLSLTSGALPKLTFT